MNSNGAETWSNGVLTPSICQSCGIPASFETDPETADEFVYACERCGTEIKRFKKSGLGAPDWAASFLMKLRWPLRSRRRIEL
jgi:hypothetical protein